MKAHWHSSCPHLPTKKMTSSSTTTFDASLLPHPDTIPPEYMDSQDDKLRYEWVAYYRNKAFKYDNLHQEEGETWIYLQSLLDIVKLLTFAIKYCLSNKGVEALIVMMRELAPTAERITSLPSTWRTLTKRAMEGFDPSCYERHSFPVPPELGLEFSEVPFILKKFKDVIQDLLLDRDDMQHGNFWFGDPKGR
jgi:hypothetical protein